MDANYIKSMTFVDTNGEKRTLSEANTGDYIFSKDIKWWIYDINKQLEYIIQ